MIQVGDQLPDISVTTADGSTLRLRDFVGKHSLVLFFYPRDGSPVCTQEACSFRDSYERFVEIGAEVMGISGDSSASHRSFAQQHRLPFPLISDSDGALRKAFGVPKTLGFLPGRVTYVVDKAGIVRLVFSAAMASDEHVQKAEEALRNQLPS